MDRMSKLRLRTFAVLCSAVLAAGIVAVTGPPASAAEVGDAKVWVGPGCPDEGWTCQTDGPVVQSTSTGRDLEAACTLEDCEIVQSNSAPASAGDNLARCEQATGANQSCSVQQTNTNGSNAVDFSQTVTLTHTAALGVVETVTQQASQAVEIDQSNGSGTNRIGSSGDGSEQTIVASADSQVSLTATHSQQVNQSIEATQTSLTGAQDNHIDQFLDVSSSASGVNATQLQNTIEPAGGKAFQDVDITMRGPGGGSTFGVNTAEIGQRQDLTQDAQGPAGLPVLLNAVQTQGAGDPVTHITSGEAAFIVWDVDSKIGSTVTDSQLKNWTQHAEPAGLSGTRVQDQLDQFKILGLGLTTDFGDSKQRANLVNDGDRICVQEAELHHKRSGKLSQNCNLDGEEFTADFEDQDIYSKLVCTATNDVNAPECPVRESESSSEREVTGEQGLGSGFWKNSTDSWPGDAQPGDRFGDHFTGASVRFASLADNTLLEAIDLPGGGSQLEQAAGNLARQAVAALLNAEHDGVDYPLFSTEVRDKVNDVLANGNRNQINAVKDELQDHNGLGCDDADCPNQ